MELSQSGSSSLISDMILESKKRKRPVKRTTGPKKARPDYQKGRELMRPKMELKAFDIAETITGSTAVAAAPVGICLNAMVNGAELFQRIGRKTYMRSLHFRGFIQNAATSVQDIGRIVILYDSQANAALPTYVSVFQDSNVGAASAILSGVNLTNRARFKILRDYPVMLPSCTFAGGVITNFAMQDTVNKSLEVDFFIKLKGLETEYNGVNGGTIADITSGSLILFFASDNSSNKWQIEWTSRLRYYD